MGLQKLDDELPRWGVISEGEGRERRRTICRITRGSVSMFANSFMNCFLMPFSDFL